MHYEGVLGPSRYLGQCAKVTEPCVKKVENQMPVRATPRTS